MLPQPGFLCGFWGSLLEQPRDRLDSASVPQGRQDLAGRARAGPAREGSFQEGKPLWRPSPRHPRARRERRRQAARATRAKALGSRAGIPRAACTLQCWRETFQRETRACKLNGEFASRSLQTLVPPPSPSTFPSPQTRETLKTDTGKDVRVGRAGPSVSTSVHGGCHTALVFLTLA